MVQPSAKGIKKSSRSQNQGLVVTGKQGKGMKGTKAR